MICGFKNRVHNNFQVRSFEFFSKTVAKWINCHMFFIFLRLIFDFVIMMENIKINQSSISGIQFQVPNNVLFYVSRNPPIPCHLNYFKPVLLIFLWKSSLNKSFQPEHWIIHGSIQKLLESVINSFTKFKGLIIERIFLAKCCRPGLFMKFSRVVVTLSSLMLLWSADSNTGVSILSSVLAIMLSIVSLMLLSKSSCSLINSLIFLFASFVFTNFVKFSFNFWFSTFKNSSSWNVIFVDILSDLFSLWRWKKLKMVKDI